MDDIEITYEIEDGYVGGARPQYTTIDIEHFRDMTDEEIKNELSDQIHEEMLQNINASYNEEDILQQIKAALAKSPEEA